MPEAHRNLLQQIGRDVLQAFSFGLLSEDELRGEFYARFEAAVTSATRDIIAEAEAEMEAFKQPRAAGLMLEAESIPAELSEPPPWI